MLKRFIAYYKPHLKLFSLDMLASFFVSLIGLLYPIITRNMLNDYIPNRKFDLVIYFGVGLLILYIIRMFLKYFVQYYGHMVGVYMQSDMRRDMFRQLQKLPFSFFDNHETGKIMSRMTNDLMEISELAHHGPENLFMSGMMIVGSFIYLSTINLDLTLIIFACVPFLLVIALILRKKMRVAFLESRKSIAVINASLESSVSGIRVTKAFNNAAKEEEKFAIGDKEFVKARSKAYKAMGQFYASTGFITDVFNVIVLISGGIFLYNGTINFGDYSAFIVSVSLFVTPLTTLIQFTEQYQNGVTGFLRFLEVMDQTPEKAKKDPIELNKAEGNIVFDQVEFGYDNKRRILKGVSFKINKGETLALVGPSGGGKTTVCHLLPNFYHATKGAIYLDGIDIEKISYESLRENIGIVQQDVFLFNGSIYENILYGRLDATYDEVVTAAKMANIYDYVMTLPDGFDTQIGERGVKLSGGQKQRLSIARVFLKNPSILILDEATSALDNTTEILIQNALDRLCEGRTTIVVAHRLSTIKNADRILVINNGIVIESGSHDELLNLQGVYAKLYNLQFATKEDRLNFDLAENY